MTLWCEREGGDGAAVLLLHGLGATGAVWCGTAARLRERTGLATIVVDLPGHGASPWQPTYSAGEMAAALAPLLRDVQALHVIGHSLGVYVGLALASSWFNCPVASLTGIGPKVRWTDDDFARMRELAQRPVKHYATRDEALERYRRASGLDGKTAPDPSSLDRGILESTAGHRLAADPATMAVGAPPFAGLVSLARCPVALACGELDRMVTVTDLREFSTGAIQFAGLGHNAHVESPDAIVDLFESVQGRAIHA